jgi:hypothetical protein
MYLVRNKGQLTEPRSTRSVLCGAPGCGGGERYVRVGERDGGVGER